MGVLRTTWRCVRVAQFAAPDDSSRSGNAVRSKEYNRAKQRVMLAGLLVSTVGGAILVVSGIPKRLSDRVDQATTNKWLRRGLFAALLTLAESVMTLPLGYVSGYVLEHRFNLSNQSRFQWAIDQMKGLAVALPFTVAGANLLLEIIDRWPKRWWAITTALALPFTVLLSQLAPVLLMPIFNRFEPLKDQALADRLKKLAQDSGISVASVLQMDMSRQTKKANAFFAGMGRTRRIVLADTLLESFTPEQIEEVVAHEIAHQAHRDLWRFVALGTIFTAGLSWSVDFLASNIIRRYGTRIHVPALDHVSALPLLSWLLSLTALMLAPLQNLYSRHIERRADTYALKLTNNPNAFESAMQRLAEINLADPSPSAFVKYTMYSHPPIAERIDRARRFGKGEG